MPFAEKIKEKALVASARHCCVCRRFKSVKVEVHHIIPEKKGGDNTYDNAIVLCFDCHTDAGHYNSEHPKGTKFSPSELKKQRDAWYEIVKKNKIQIYQKTNLIHSVYYVTKNSEVISEIAKGDLSKFPIKDVIVHDNDILKFQKNFLEDYQSEPDFKRINDFPVTEAKNYLSKFPDAEILNKNKDYPKYLYKRTPKKEEVDKFCKNKIFEFLLESGLDVKDIFRVYTYIEKCGQTPYLQDILTWRNIWVCYLCITNISNDYLSLDSINFKGNSLSNYQKTFDALSNSEGEHKLSLPKIQIEPKRSILIPILTLLAPFEGEDIEEYSSIEQEIGYAEEEQVLIYGKLYEIENSSKFLILGSAINPCSLNIKDNGNTIIQDIHEFDFSNLYLINRYWSCGCCPHIFLKRDNDLEYQSEVFAKRPDELQIFKIIIPNKVNNFILAELEHEETFILYLKINKKTVVKNKFLNKEEYVEFRVGEGDIIEGSGFYSLKEKSKNMLSPIIKNDIIKRFILRYKESCQIL